MFPCVLRNPKMTSGVLKYCRSKSSDIVGYHVTNIYAISKSLNTNSSPFKGINMKNMGGDFYMILTWFLLIFQFSMPVSGPGKGIGGLMELLRFGKTEYQLIWSRDDPNSKKIQETALFSVLLFFVLFWSPEGFHRHFSPYFASLFRHRRVL